MRNKRITARIRKLSIYQQAMDGNDPRVDHILIMCRLLAQTGATLAQLDTYCAVAMAQHVPPNGTDCATVNVGSHTGNVNSQIG